MRGDGSSPDFKTALQGVEDVSSMVDDKGAVIELSGARWSLVLLADASGAVSVALEVDGEVVTCEQY